MLQNTKILQVDFFNEQHKVEIIDWHGKKWELKWNKEGYYTEEIPMTYFISVGNFIKSIYGVEYITSYLGGEITYRNYYVKQNGEIRE